MNEFQLFLFLIAVGIFAIFFKQLFSGNYPKRGIDYEAKLPDSQIGGISEPTKVFKSAEDKRVSRVEELFRIADES
ncbi:MAG: hypothetical protein GXN91_05110, partial [Epsilonproteobacteria bacterium]|nr:hypothetical protein [Campylobacterota bacterium]